MYIKLVEIPSVIGIPPPGLGPSRAELNGVSRSYICIHACSIKQQTSFQAKYMCSTIITSCGTHQAGAYNNSKQHMQDVCPR